MKRFQKFGRILILVGLMGTSILVTSLWAAPSIELPASGFIVEYSVPHAPLNIVAEDTGRVWFTLPDANMIGSLTVNTTSAHTLYPIPTAGSEPYDLAYDGNNTIWFTEKAANKLGRLDMTTGNVLEYVIPTSNSQPTGIAISPDGSIWFTEKAGNKVGRFFPNTTAFEEYPYPKANAQMEDIAITTVNSIWVTAPNLNELGNLDVTGNQLISVPTQSLTITGLQPMHIVTDEAGLPWVTMRGNNLIGRYTPGTLTLWRWYEVEGSPVGLDMNMTTSGMNIWSTLPGSNAVAALGTQTNGSLTFHGEQTLPTANSNPWGVAVDAQGNVWVAQQGNNSIAVWIPPYYHTTNLPLTSVK